MIITLILSMLLSVTLFLRGRGRKKSLEHMLSPFSILLTVILCGVHLVMASGDVREDDGTPRKLINAKAELVAQRIKSGLERKGLSQANLLLLLPPSAGEGMVDQSQLFIEQLQELLPNVNISSEVALQQGFRAVTVNHYEKALEGNEWDVLVSLIGLPQDLDKLQENSCFNVENRKQKILMIAAGGASELAFCLENKLFDWALLPKSIATSKVNSGKEVVLDGRKLMEFSID